MKKFEVQIVNLPDQILRKKSVDVPIPLTQEDIELAEKMIYHIDDSQKEGSEFRPGVGVAAIQYGVLKNVFYVYLPDDKGNPIFKDVLFNPKIVRKSDQLVALSQGEGCLSVPEDWPKQEGYVPRSYKITVQAYSFNKQGMYTFDLTGYLAIIFQHELDHLNGKLFIDRINQKDPWKKPNRRTILI
ncbi:MULTISPECIES: peptide deformylase [unclassified Mycoplasma]|uniref:peptide deformylase n=1 Tax=unclassified Mycoplasma TaxID=2683645 RepID=UPI00211BF7A2|nr:MULTISPECIES: peptide deformylase [unclassified Mycoplasma]UUM19775.1 peptide deformylase [Mycoplasma sp. 1578d]UUM24758.1 peptide deformylase [Mycoplasma sp. 3686d]